MPIRFHCSDCRTRIRVPDGSDGKKVKCPRCGRVQVVPADKPKAADPPDEVRLADDPINRPKKNKTKPAYEPKALKELSTASDVFSLKAEDSAPAKEASEAPTSESVESPLPQEQEIVDTTSLPPPAREPVSEPPPRVSEPPLEEAPEADKPAEEAAAEQPADEQAGEEKPAGDVGPDLGELADLAESVEPDLQKLAEAATTGEVASDDQPLLELSQTPDQSMDSAELPIQGEVSREDSVDLSHAAQPELEAHTQEQPHPLDRIDTAWAAEEAKSHEEPATEVKPAPKPVAPAPITPGKPAKPAARPAPAKVAPASPDPFEQALAAAAQVPAVQPAPAAPARPAAPPPPLLALLIVAWMLRVFAVVALAATCYFATTVGDELMPKVRLMVILAGIGAALVTWGVAEGGAALRRHIQRRTG